MTLWGDLVVYSIHGVVTASHFSDSNVREVLDFNMIYFLRGTRDSPNVLVTGQVSINVGKICNVNVKMAT